MASTGEADVLPLCVPGCSHAPPAKIAEASVRREVYQGDTLVKDPPTWEFLLPSKVKR